MEHAALVPAGSRRIGQHGLGLGIEFGGFVRNSYGVIAWNCLGDDLSMVENFAQIMWRRI